MVGTELALVMQRVGVQACDDCKLTVEYWNRRGVTWCDDHFDLMVRWLVSQFRRRKLSRLFIGGRIAFAFPRITMHVMALKLRFWRTAIEELGAVAVADYAIERARLSARQLD